LIKIEMFTTLKKFKLFGVKTLRIWINKITWFWQKLRVLKLIYVFLTYQFWSTFFCVFL